MIKYSGKICYEDLIQLDKDLKNCIRGKHYFERPKDDFVVDDTQMTKKEYLKRTGLTDKSLKMLQELANDF